MGVEGCSDKLRSGEVGEVPGLRLPRACLGDAPVCSPVSAHFGGFQI